MLTPLGFLLAAGLGTIVWMFRPASTRTAGSFVGHVMAFFAMPFIALAAIALWMILATALADFSR